MASFKTEVDVTCDDAGSGSRSYSTCFLDVQDKMSRSSAMVWQIHSLEIGNL
ncbi:MAG: hypothetical protein ACTSUE_07400 [Promethearchaeota archaeon]